MKEILSKLNYRDWPRICVLNGDNKFIMKLRKVLPSKKIDPEIDPKYLYEFIIIIAYKIADIEEYTPPAVHNLGEDGLLWVFYPKKSSDRFSSDISRDKGWDILKKNGFKAVRQVSVDDNFSALRFRNTKFVKSGDNK